MKINFENNSRQPSFQAIKIAQTRSVLKNLETKIDLYELSHKDTSFLNGLEKNIKLKNLMPDMDYLSIERWQEMLEYAVYNAKCADNKTIVGITENKPCGILTYFEGNKFNLDCICTFPVEVGRKVKFAGKTLFLELFKRLKESKGKGITLQAITNGPFDNVRKYKELGFLTGQPLKNKIKMEISPFKAEDSLKKLQDIIEYSPVSNQEKADLMNII